MGYLDECMLSINLISFMRQNRHEHVCTHDVFVSYQILRLLSHITQSRLSMVHNEQIDVIRY